MSQQGKSLTVTNLCKTYGDQVVLKDLTFEVGRGEIVGFLGVNGAGKSTTIHIISGLVAPTSGSVKIDGQEINGRHRKTTEDLGIMFETPAFYTYLSAKKNLDILNKLSGNSNVNIDKVIELVGLKEAANVKVGKYSQGMRQRLGFAQAILNKPDLLILDEPTNGLDPYGIKEIKDLIKDMATRENMTVFLSSHLLSEVEQLVDRVIIINEGTIVTTKIMSALREENVCSLEEYFLKKTKDLGTNKVGMDDS